MDHVAWIKQTDWLSNVLSDLPSCIVPFLVTLIGFIVLHFYATLPKEAALDVTFRPSVRPSVLYAYRLLENGKTYNVQT